VQVSGQGVPELNCLSLPFGNDLGNPRATDCVPAPNATALAADAAEPHFTGKERDTESGNDYFEARYYSSSMGRFMSPDWSAKEEPVPYAKMDNPQTLNLYAYMLNNPLGGVDADGHFSCESSACREWAFAASHPWIAREVGPVFTALSPIGLHSTNISTNAVRFTTGMGLSENASHEGSEVNAMRHTLWSSTITSQYGAGIAQQIGNAHEDNPNVDLSIRSFSGKGAMAQADQTTGLLNNQIGQSIGAANPGASMNQLAGAALDYYHSTGLYTAATNADGTVSVSQTKLSDQQYSAAKQQLQKMDDKGFKQ
jgi:RHS repeat-associated protein